METITDPAEIRATDEPDERGDFPCCTTPAPVGAAVELDLDAARAMLNAANTIKATGGAVEIGGVRIEPCDEYGSTVTTARAESAEAEVVTLRARLAAVEALADQWADRKRSDGMSGNAWIGLTLSGVAADLRAALCGYDKEHDQLLEHGWSRIDGKSGGGAGYSTRKDNGRREGLWLSPACIQAEQTSLFELGGAS